MNTLDIERLKECRLKLGITKQEAAKRIQISQPAYLRYEAGTRQPSVQTIEKIAEVFSTSADYLIGKTSEAANVEIRTAYRDEDTDLIDLHLTNGGRAIPIYVILNEAGEVVGKWGPRAPELQRMVRTL